MPRVQVSDLRIHPVKSCAPRVVERLEIEPWGAAADRRWAVVEPDGSVLTARDIPQLLRLEAEPSEDGLVLRWRGEELAVGTPYDGHGRPVGFSRLPTASDAGDEAAAYLSRALGRPVRLVWQPEPTLRSVNPRNGGRDGDVLSLADAGPLLLTSEASLAHLQEWVGPSPDLAMSRFRPNVLVDGDVPWAEDGWASVRLGDVDFRVQALCDRCVVTTIDPVTLDRGPEPIRSLAAHRRRDGKVHFGIWLVPRAVGVVERGARVQAR